MFSICLGFVYGVFGVGILLFLLGVGEFGVVLVFVVILLGWCDLCLVLWMLLGLVLVILGLVVVVELLVLLVVVVSMIWLMVLILIVMLLFLMLGKLVDLGVIFW